jgi:hypothetical protein
MQPSGFKTVQKSRPRQDALKVKTKLPIGLKAIRASSARPDAWSGARTTRSSRSPEMVRPTTSRPLTSRVSQTPSSSGDCLYSPFSEVGDHRLSSLTRVSSDGVSRVSILLAPKAREPNTAPNSPFRRSDIPAESTPYHLEQIVAKRQRPSTTNALRRTSLSMNTVNDFDFEAAHVDLSPSPSSMPVMPIHAHTPKSNHIIVIPTGRHRSKRGAESAA